MKRSRPSIAGLMALIAHAATALAALRGANALWTSITFTASLAILSLSILGALYCKSPARITWTGFAACIGPAPVDPART
jgi:hypothetical protein